MDRKRRRELSIPESEDNTGKDPETLSWFTFTYNHFSFPGGSDGKESSCKEGDLGLIPGLGRSPGEGNGYPHQFHGQRSLVGYSPRSCKESDTTEHSNTHSTNASLVITSLTPSVSLEDCFVASIITLTATSVEYIKISNLGSESELLAEMGSESISSLGSSSFPVLS